MAMTGRKIHADGSWKTLQISAELRDQGLLGIEELSDYSLIKVRNKAKKAKTTITAEATELAEKKKNKKKKKKKKKQVVAAESKPTKEDADIKDEETEKGKGQKRKNGETKEETTKNKKKKRDKIITEKVEPAAAKKEVEESLAFESDSDDEEMEFEDLTAAPSSDEDEQVPDEVLDSQDADVSAWKELFVPEPVLRALKDLGFKEPTPIQKNTLPAAIKGRRDIIGAAETGSGKTLAFAIPIIHGILIERQNEAAREDSSEHDSEDEVALEDEEEETEEGNETGCVKVMDNVEFDFEVGDQLPFPEFQVPSKVPKLKALILTPTRELAIQVKNHIAAVAKYTDIKVAVVVGGMASQKQERVLKKGPEIVVATPGRLWDLIQGGNPHLSTCTEIKYLAIDETDRMVEKGHFEELKSLLEMINLDEEKKKLRQTFVFSATLTLIHELPKHQRDKKKSKNLTTEEKLQSVTEMIGLKSKPKIVDITRKMGTAESLTESCIHCIIKEKDFYLYYFIMQHPGRTLVFCNSIDCVRRLVNLFGYLKCEVLGLHAQMHQKQRLKNLERFSANPRCVLIATDVAARGLDIPDVEHVFHYQVPRTSESYVHRSGRTARASKEGISVMLIDPSENHLYKRMCKTLNRADELPSFPVDSKMMASVKERVNKARELDKLMLANKKEEIKKSWFKKAAEEADLIVSSESEDENFANSADKTASTKGAIQVKRHELNAMLSTPLYGSGFSGKYLTMTGSLHLPQELDRGAKMQSALEKIQNESSERKRILKKSKILGLTTNVIVKNKRKKTKDMKRASKAKKPAKK